MIANDRMGLLADISVMLAQMEVPIVAVSAHAERGAKQRANTTTIDLVLDIRDTNQLEDIIHRLLRRGDIIEGFRTNS